MKLLLPIFLFIVSVSSQTLLHPLRLTSDNQNPKLISRNNFDTLKILAIRVQFKKDYDERTSGNGEFDLSIPNTLYADAPPRDSIYFSDHLEFSKNYFQKASNGKQIISSTIFPKVITVSDSMIKYAPSNNNYTPLANLIVETWQKADSTNPNFAFEKYNMFIIFHAGIGRDVDLRDALGYEPTPFDLPSIYFNLSTFKNIFGSNFSGIKLKNRNFTITNSALLPETENRFIPSVSGLFHYKLGINGLITSMIGSHLGLPDLFDTKTGRSVIGRFGLMDGESIFSFHGLFPPEPSAWEKIYLGWVEPITLSKNINGIILPAVSKYSSGSDTIYKIPISAKEYFLIENRHRDAKENDQQVTLKWQGSVIKKTIKFDDDSVNYSTNNFLFGNIIDVDELDWSLPGVKDNIFSYQGGMLIWHINENVIEKNYSSNNINADANNRGVTLVEADGSNDIGQQYSIFHPGGGAESGSIFDLWFKDNNAPLYKNEFSEKSTPNSKSQSKAHTNITLKNFSKNFPIATFDFEKRQSKISIELVRKINSIKKNYNDSPVIDDINNDGTPEIIYTSGDSIFCITSEGKSIFRNTSGIFSDKGGKFQPIVIKNLILPNTKLVAGVSDSSIYLFQPSDMEDNGIADNYLTINLFENISTPLSFGMLENNKSYFVVGTKTGKVFKIGIDGFTISKDKLFESSGEVKSLILSKDEVLAVYDSKIVNNKGKSWNFTSQIISASYISNSWFSLIPRLVIVTSDGRLTFIQRNSDDLKTYLMRSIPTAPHSIADVNDDGMADILIPTSEGISAYQWNGVPVEKFPIQVKDGGKILSAAILAGKKNSKEKLIFFGTDKGHLYSFNNNGEMISGFPVQTSGFNSNISVYNSYIAVTSLDSSIYFWKTSDLIDTTKTYWNNFLGDPLHTNNYSVIENSPPTVSELMTSNSIYNWPNPVYENTTYIRYHLNNEATVTIKIFAINGEKIIELAGTNYVGMDNEIAWDVSSVKSGIYFAHVVAEKNNSKYSKLIKIAVVK